MTGVREPWWIPDRLAAEGGRTICGWVDAAGIPFVDPFFEMSLARCRHEQRARMTSTLEHLHERAAREDAVAPVFIFHVSRCGSTLFSQLLALDANASVLSEVPLLDEILRSARDDRAAMFDAALRMLGRSRSGAGARLFVKTDCWHLFHAPLLRTLYPLAPFILLYRAPAAVLASQKKARGIHMVPGLLPAPPFHVDYDPAGMSLDRYGARVLEQHYQSMLDLAAGDRRALLVNYGEGFPDAFFRAADWLGLSFDGAHAARVRERCAYHAKRPQEAFREDAAPPPPDAGLAPLEILFARLESLRAASAIVASV